MKRVFEVSLYCFLQFFICRGGAHTVQIIRQFHEILLSLVYAQAGAAAAGKEINDQAHYLRSSITIFTSLPRAWRYLAGMMGRQHSPPSPGHLLDPWLPSQLRKSISSKSWQSGCLTQV